MSTYQEQIENKYKRISSITEFLLSFTVPIRIQAISSLNLTPGSAVVDVGCGTGASFLYLENIIGASGMILGIEPSSSMMSIARERVTREGWKNVILYESIVEEIEVTEKYDGALLFAMHDVFNSQEGLKKIHLMLKDSARVVCVGPKIQDRGFLKMFNPMLHLLFKRMALSQDNKDKPWRLVAELFVTEKIIEEKHGLIFIYVGRK